MNGNKTLIENTLTKSLNATEQSWVFGINQDIKEIKKAFVLTPRFITKNEVDVSGLFAFNIKWTSDRLVRVYFLVILEELEPINFEKELNQLFDTAEIKESIALFSSLFLLKNPEKWVQKATDAVRSNIGNIFETIAFETPFASKYFTELAWNQMVLKCIFNDKPIQKIIGLSQRANQKLADTLSDFAHERWAAGREVPAFVWQLVSNFLNEKILIDLEKLLMSDNENEKFAAYLICLENKKANFLLEKHPQNFSDDLLAKGWHYLG